MTVRSYEEIRSDAFKLWAARTWAAMDEGERRQWTLAASKYNKPATVRLRGNPMSRDMQLVIGYGDHSCWVFDMGREHIAELAMEAPRAYVQWGGWDGER